MRALLCIVFILLPGFMYGQDKNPISARNVPIDTPRRDSLAPGKMKHYTSESKEITFSIAGLADSCGKISMTYDDIPLMRAHWLKKDTATINLKLSKNGNRISLLADRFNPADSFYANIVLDDGDKTYIINSLFKKGRTNFIYIRRK